MPYIHGVNRPPKRKGAERGEGPHPLGAMSELTNPSTSEHVPCLSAIKVCSHNVLSIRLATNSTNYASNEQRSPGRWPYPTASYGHTCPRLHRRHRRPAEGRTVWKSGREQQRWHGERHLPPAGKCTGGIAKKVQWLKCVYVVSP